MKVEEHPEVLDSLSLSKLEKIRREKQMITVKSYDGRMVTIPEEKKNEYEKNQRLIKMYLKQGKTKEEIKELLKIG